MRKAYLIFLMIGLFFWLNCQNLQAQATVRGTITDAETGEPLARVNVFLSGTQLGAATNKAGFYHLDAIPVGGYRLVISIIGYQRKVVNIVVGYNEELEKSFKLKPVVYKLPDLFVGEYGEDWQKNLKRFKNYFIGQTGMADSVEILNPKALVFEKNWWGKMTAEALAPLMIENKALGYYITYYLKEFSQSGGLTKWDGEPFFVEMTPADSAQAAYWKRNRERAFYGSLRNLLLALIDRRIDDSGFVLYNIRQGMYGPSSTDQDQISGERIIEQGKKDFLYDLNFFGRLKIVYLKEEEVPGYVDWLRGRRRAPRSVQTSFLDLNEHPVTVDVNGEIILPYAATQFGYFSFQRLAYLTPKGYRPEGY